jgi:hypothetical protein
MLQDKSKKLIKLIPTKYSHVFDVKLNLEFQTRFIGKVDTSGEGTFITTRKEKHLFRKTNSLGINYALLADESIPFKWIVINYNERGLITTRNYYLQKGKAFQFSKKNFELQSFVPLTELNRKTAEQFEKSNGKQDDLFALAV